MDEQTAIIALDKKISIADFRLLYELDPAFPSYKRGAKGLQEFAEKVAAKVLAVEFAKEEGVFEEKAAKYALDYRRKIATIRSFYKDIIEDEIEISLQELHSEFLGMSARVQLKQLFTPKEDEGQDLYTQLEKGIPFDTLSAHVFKDIGGKSAAELGLVSWGELNESLEKTAWSLRPGEYSPPVRSKWGYHILYVTARHELFVPSNDEFTHRRQTVYKKVKRKKEEKAANAYLKDYLTPLDIKVKSNTFIKLAGALNFDLESGKQSSRPLQNDRMLPSISNAQIEQIEKTLEDELNAPFMTSAAENWSIQQFLDKVKQIPQYKRSKLFSLSRFKDDIGIMIRNDFLYKRAVQEGHHQNSFVDSTVNDFAEELAYQYYLRRYFFDMDVPEYVVKYFASIKENGKNRLSKPEDVLKGMREIKHYKAYYSTQKLHQDLFEKFPRADINYNKAFLEEEANRINWNNPIRMFVPDNF